VRLSANVSPWASVAVLVDSEASSGHCHRGTAPESISDDLSRNTCNSRDGRQWAEVRGNRRMFANLETDKDSWRTQLSFYSAPEAGN